MTGRDLFPTRGSKGWTMVVEELLSKFKGVVERLEATHTLPVTVQIDRDDERDATEPNCWMVTASLYGTQRAWQRGLTSSEVEQAVTGLLQIAERDRDKEGN